MSGSRPPPAFPRRRVELRGSARIGEGLGSATAGGLDEPVDPAVSSECASRTLRGAGLCPRPQELKRKGVTLQPVVGRILQGAR